MHGNLGWVWAGVVEDDFKALYKVMTVFLISTTKYSYVLLSFSALAFSLETQLCYIHTHIQLLQNFLLRILTTERITVVTAQKLRAKALICLVRNLKFHYTSIGSVMFYMCLSCPSTTWWSFRFFPSSVLRFMPMPTYGTGKTDQWTMGLYQVVAKTQLV